MLISHKSTVWSIKCLLLVITPFSWKTLLIYMSALEVFFRGNTYDSSAVTLL